ncbi:Uncharacterised protein [Mycobacteroides abscessus]|nr:Uncharacterised protein [Mycobacteroides abscessus]
MSACPAGGAAACHRIACQSQSLSSAGVRPSATSAPMLATWSAITSAAAPSNPSPCTSASTLISVAS